MKLSALAAAIAVCLAGFAGAVNAQQNANSSSNNVTWIGSQTPSAPESASAARAEAEAVMRQARQDCKNERGTQARKDCMKSAQDDYNDMTASTRSMNRDSSSMNRNSMNRNSMKRGTSNR